MIILSEWLLGHLKASGTSGNLGIISHFLHKNIFCDQSLEPSHRDGSNEGSQSMFSLGNKKKLSLNYLQ